MLKGLKFTPTPQHDNTEELRKDLSEFHRRLRLQEYFLNSEKSTNPSIVKNKSNFQPPKGRNDKLEMFINVNESFVKNAEKRSINHNINLKERNALKSLQNDTDIIVKEADKGSGIVIMNKTYYKSKILEMLNDKEFYEEFFNRLL